MGESFAPDVPDTLTREIDSLDAWLRGQESDWNADADMLGNVFASVNVTGLRESVARIRGIWEAKREEFVGALKVAEHALTTSHNLRATDLTVEAFDGFLAAGRDRSELEFMTNFTFDLSRIERALAPYLDDTGKIRLRNVSEGAG